MAFCTGCGTELKEGARFCGSCGAAAGGAPTNAPAANNYAGYASGLAVGGGTAGTTRSAPGYDDDEQPVENLSLYGYFVKCLKNYATFDGRARRKEQWGVILIFAVINVVLDIVGMIGDEIAIVAGVISLLVSLALSIPSLAVVVRRLHDVGKSGWYYLWCFTIIGIIPVAIYTLFIDGQPMENDYGPSPKYPEI